MHAKLLNIFALSTLAVLLCSFAPTQTFALSVQKDHLARHIPNHHGIAKKKKRGNCKPRNSSSSPPADTPASQPTSTPAQNNYNPPPSSSPPSSSSSTPSTSPSSTPATTPATTHSGSGKLAIAWALGDDPRIAILLASPYVVMFHLWTSTIPDSVKNSGLPVSIMLWDTSASNIQTFVQNAQPGYATYAYGMNEVNEPSQGYTSVPDAVSAWNSYIKPLASQGYTLGSPCTTSAPDGFDWVTSFLASCTDCGVQEMPIHWYDVQFTDFQAYIEKWAAAFKLPIRVTEFACQNFNGGDQPSADDIWSFTTQAITWLDSSSLVESYAPFGFMDDMYNVNPADCLFSGSTLSALGWKYVNDNN